MVLANKYGGVAIVSYFLNELAKNTNHTSFDDSCYWKDVEVEFKARFKARLKYEN